MLSKSETACGIRNCQASNAGSRWQYVWFPKQHTSVKLGTSTRAKIIQYLLRSSIYVGVIRFRRCETIHYRLPAHIYITLVECLQYDSSKYDSASCCSGNIKGGRIMWFCFKKIEFTGNGILYRQSFYSIFHFYSYVKEIYASCFSRKMHNVKKRREIR